MTKTRLHGAAIMLCAGAVGCAQSVPDETEPSRSTAALSPSGSGSGFTLSNTPPPRRHGGPGARETAAQSELVVKLRSSGPHAVTECAERWITEGRSFALATADGSSSLDRMRVETRLTHARAVDPRRRWLSTSEARGRFDALLAGVSARFPRRTGRVSSAGAPASVPDLTNLYVFEFAQGVNLQAAAQRIVQDSHVEYVQPNYVVHANFTPNDPYYSSTGSWGQPYDDLWGLKQINASAAWDRSRGTGVVVAVVDTGADGTHPDLGPNLWKNSDEIAGNGVDDDGNGFVDDTWGWNFVAGSPSPLDDHGHGTHVAGIIGAVGNNGLGIVGAAHGARIMPVKGLDANGNGNSDVLALAIRYAAENGADVINNSWACDSCPSNPVVEEAVAYARGLGAVPVFAAGNRPEDDILVRSPQNRPDVIVVSASDQNDQVTSFSSFGFLDVAAPGGGIEVAPPDLEPQRNVLSLQSSLCSSEMCAPGLSLPGQVLRQAGTSMATPYVSGVAALVLQLYPSYSPEEVRQVLRRSSTDLLPTGYDTRSGYGRIDASRALLEPRPLTALITSPVPLTPLTGTLGQLDVVGSASGTGFSNYRVEVGAGTAPSSWTRLASSTTRVTNGHLAYFNPATRPDGAYSLRVVATTTDGRSYEDRQRVDIDQVVITNPDPSGPIKFARSGDVVTVSGTVNPANFSRYAFSVLKSDGTALLGANLTLTGGGTQKIVNGVLGTWNTAGVATDQYQLALTVTLTSGGPTVETVAVVVDPTLHPGWPEQAGDPGMEGRMVAADVNGDGKQELIVSLGDRIGVLDHTGAELPGWPQSVDPLNQGHTYSRMTPAVGDVTGDGIPEIVGSNEAGDVIVWRRDGTLLPGWPRAMGPAEAGAPPHVAIANVDGVGNNEIVVTAYAPPEDYSTMRATVAVLRSDGTFAPGWPLSFVSGPPSAPAVGDVDGDGNAEIAVAMANPPMDVYLFTSTGATMPGWPKQNHPSPDPSIALVPIHPALADLDGDGKLELVISAPLGNVWAYRTTGTVLPGWPQLTRAVIDLWSPTVGDITGDGRLEVVANPHGHDGATNEMFAFSASGQLLPGWPVQFYDPSGFGWGFYSFGSAALADVSGDGIADVVASSDRPHNAPYFGMHAYDRTGHEVSGFPKIVGAVGNGPDQTPVVADLDGDGLSELAWTDLYGRVYVWDLTAPASGAVAWPMARHDAAKTGCVTASVPQNRPPTVSISAPSSGATFTAPASITINATASDSDGTITKVEFRQGSTLLNTDTAAPYSATWTSVPAGTYTLTATAYDNLNASGVSTPVSITVNPSGGTTPCAGLCTNPIVFTGPNYQSGNLGTGAACRETMSTLHGGNCSNMQSRLVTVNGTTVSCNGWAVPSARNGGYCIQVTAGSPSWASFATW